MKTEIDKHIFFAGQERTNLEQHIFTKHGMQDQI